MAENKDFSLVGINKASVFPEIELEKLKNLKAELKETAANLRLVKMTLEETDYFA